MLGMLKQSTHAYRSRMLICGFNKCHDVLIRKGLGKAQKQHYQLD